jgi:cell division protein FtsL
MGGSPKVNYISGQHREAATKNKRRVFRPGKKLPVIITVFLLVYLSISFLMHFHKIYALQNDILQIEMQVKELKLKNDELRRQLNQVQSDAYIEQVAREKLGLVKPGETRIIPLPKTVEKNN